MPKLTIKKSIVIHSTAEKIFPAIRDFKQWPKWSPWLIAEPGCPLTYAEDGKSYSWDGEIIGSGEMAVESEEKNRSIDSRLTFLKPWKSVSKIRFELAEKEGGTEVTWTMDGSLPIFLFFLKNMMTTFVGMDYERGLNMLKDYVETGAVPVKLDFPGQAPFEGFSYVGIHNLCPISEMAPQMKEKLGQLGTLINSKKIEPSGPPMSIYHKWNPGKGMVDYTLAVPVAEIPSDLPSEWVTGEIPSVETYTVQLSGPYRHLGNAWSAGHMHARGKVFRQNKKVPPFEIYKTDPTETPVNEHVTEVHFPAK